MATMQLQSMQHAATPAASKPYTIFDLLETPKVRQGFAAVAGKYLSADKLIRLAVLACRRTKNLDRCNPQSVLGAFMLAAGLGLEPNTALQEAFLIPYKRRAQQDGRWVDVYDCQFQIGYRGFVTLAHRSPHIQTIQASAICHGDKFRHMMGSNTMLEFEISLAERGDLIGAFCFTKLTGGGETATVLPLQEILKIRDKSETYLALARAVEAAAPGSADLRKAQEKFDATPWVLWLNDMAAKSAVKKHAKWLGLSGDPITAAAQVDTDGGRTFDVSAMSDPDVLRQAITDGVLPEAEPDDETPKPAALSAPDEPGTILPVAGTKNRTPVPVSPTDDGFGQID
ncbi:MAG: recombinase RecT [Rhodocyclaceae bacterium]|nr:recombinase RecT [Rhodocyclaceae bacterium]